MHGTVETLFVSVTTITIMINILLKGEAEDDVCSHYHTCYTNSADGRSIWKSQQSPTVFLNVA